MSTNFACGKKDEDAEISEECKHCGLALNIGLGCLIGSELYVSLVLSSKIAVWTFYV